MEKRDMIRGISVCNPVDVKEDYFLFTIDYAIEKKITHVQLIGPIHDYVKGNIDGMTPYRKYSQFNDEKDMDYVNYCLDVVNKGCKKASEAGIKMYFWHHELDLPSSFAEVYPEVKNETDDIEVTHPLVKDFLENRIEDFFAAYPYMHGIILTLHETKVPLLKLKNQKLDKIERVKYVTQILHDTCKKLGKELIVRPFASLEEDYVMMTKAYESISTEMMIMDKWTQFDWSLCMPHNQFYNKIKNNPLFVEADIFGEFFGKGMLPLMLKKHITDKFAYCEGFKPAGYVARIDRAGRDPFGKVNQVNIDIMNACMQGEDVDAAADKFFEERYPGYAKEVASIMENTEEILKKIIYLKGYYYSELSMFPHINHSKNHFYFEMMKKDYDIASNEWFIPKNWDRGTIESIIEEKATAVKMSEEAYNKVLALEGKIGKTEYEDLWRKFANLKYVSLMWEKMTSIFINYVRFFETRDEKYEAVLENLLAEMDRIDNEGAKLLGADYYCNAANNDLASGRSERAKKFIRHIKQSFANEKAITEKLEAEDLTDFIVCGGGMEGHRLQKEVNFSDTYVEEDTIFRIPGTYRGAGFSTVNTHGWFSYEIKVKPNTENKIKVALSSMGDSIDIKVNIDGTEYTVNEKADGMKEFEFTYTGDKDAIRIRFDRFTGNTPCVHWITVK